MTISYTNKIDIIYEIYLIVFINKYLLNINLLLYNKLNVVY